jgi:hypothetical protein
MAQSDGLTSSFQALMDLIKEEGIIQEQQKISAN